MQKRRQQVVHTFQPDEEYDPNTPNDLGEYQHYRRRLREEKRAAADANRGSDDSSYYSDSSVEAPRRDGKLPRAALCLHQHQRRLLLQRRSTRLVKYAQGYPRPRLCGPDSLPRAQPAAPTLMRSV
jgi:hypothetical protein